MKRTAARGRLRLNRETLRTLGGRQLGRVAGGSEVDPPNEVFGKRDRTRHEMPRTNAWTTETGAVADVVCGGAVTG